MPPDPPTPPSAPPAPPNDGGNDAAGPLVAMFSKRVVVVLGLVGFALATLLLLWPLLDKSRFDDSFSRTVLAFGFAFLAGLFLFILYPMNFRLTKIPRIDLTMEVVGPAALFIALTLFIRSVLPLPEAGRFHPVQKQDGSPVQHLSDLSQVSVNFPNAPDQSYKLVLSANGDHLDGLYLVYPEGTKELQVTVQLTQDYEPESFDLKREKRNPIRLKLQRKGK